MLFPTKKKYVLFLTYTEYFLHWKNWIINKKNCPYMHYAIINNFSTFILRASNF